MPSASTNSYRPTPSSARSVSGYNAANTGQERMHEVGPPAALAAPLAVQWATEAGFTPTVAAVQAVLDGREAFAEDCPSSWLRLSGYPRSPAPSPDHHVLKGPLPLSAVDRMNDCGSTVVRKGLLRDRSRPLTCAAGGIRTPNLLIRSPRWRMLDVPRP
jgi:hypothetical protein